MPRAPDFSVVAAEVKELSVQTAAATQEIAERILGMQAATKGSVQAVQNIGRAVGEMDDANTTVAAAIEEQEATLRSVAERLQVVSGNTGAVAETIQSVARSGALLSGLAEESKADIRLGDVRTDELRDNVVLVLRRMASLGDDWRQLVPLQMTGDCKTPAWSGPATILEASETVALMKLPGDQAARRALAPGSRLDLTLGGQTRIEGVVLAGSSERVLVIPPADRPQAWACLTAFLAPIRADDERYTQAARNAAREVCLVLERAIESGSLTLAAMFDDAYQPVPGSNPAQFTTAFNAHAERLVRPILDELLKFQGNVIGAFLVDRNGYAPVHNTRVSQQQRPEDPAWNAKNCRNRLLFDDRAGLTAGRTTQTYLLQSYERDMGNGERMMIKEADAPIVVCGRHYGGFRIMFLNAAPSP